MTAPLVLYDGTCGLCAKSVRWILRHEADHELKFAPIQGETTDALRATYPGIPASVDTIILIADGKAHLRRPWRWIYAFRWLPGFVLNGFYRLVAALRYRMFGRVDSCEIPSPENRVRFLP